MWPALCAIRDNDKPRVEYSTEPGYAKSAE
jgi:hypothetical protein